MKTKKFFIYIQCVVLLVAVLALSLTGCLKIGMKEKNVLDRLTSAGAQVSYERTTPITQNMQSGIKIGSIVLARLVVTQKVDGEDAEVEETAYVFFAQDARSADAIEEACKSYKNENELTHWNVYRYEEVVACGYFRIISIIRQY